MYFESYYLSKPLMCLFIPFSYEDMKNINLQGAKSLCNPTVLQKS